MIAELSGRLLLWSSALRDAAECLRLATRLAEAAGAKVVLDQEVEFFSCYRAQTGRDYVRTNAYSGDEEVHANFRPALPRVLECGMAAHYLRQLALVHFMHLYTRGDAAPGTVAPNSQMVDLRNEIERRAFPDSHDLAEFLLLREEVKDARDKLIAHADGKQFNVHHSAGSTGMTAYVVSPPLWTQLAAATRKLEASLNDVAYELRRRS